MKKASPMRSLIAWERLSMITDIMLDALRGLPRRGGLGSNDKDFNDIKVFKELKIRAYMVLSPGWHAPGDN